ncbi:uncharacterized protein BXZ73DRAFT_93312 [Epithele typhae]|uniref:uncharacterized protein n=1 Tax=Epithele typhae TaxID=378194 RepID=UPI002007A1D4|nr:uncharacterized protein BXZ73DRAFT_93312 [Epithele typhae]KAH9911827.1 hypothetical protein BXZ73DRAFT_93312 [Epithele typhae]
MFSKSHGWEEDGLPLPLPKTHSPYKTEAAHPVYVVRGLKFRRLLALVEAAVMDTTTSYCKQLHWLPHILLWSPEGDENSPPIRIFTDDFNCNDMLKEAKELHSKPRHPDDPEDLEYVILPLKFWSDATQLASFGTASLWPIYMYLGNLSKYVRARPSQFAAHHLAYIPELPDDFKDFYKSVYGVPPSPEVLKFCKRELFQQVWLKLLDDDFMHAYEHGIVLMCGDGVKRRIFPRIVTYSADYPEKMLATALRPLSNHPCHRCLIHKDKISETGSPGARLDDSEVHDRIEASRRAVFKGRSLAGKCVKHHLDDMALIPIRSALSTRLSQFGVNTYRLFVPDVMHEFELGIWKATFQQLMGMLESHGKGALQSFNTRMRATPTFGRDRIRRFSHDVSHRKRLAARDYEAFLLTIIPAFQGLLPAKDDAVISGLLFELANWHALAKLRLHTEVTVDIFKDATTHMYDAFRAFKTTCTRYEVYESKNEFQARLRREAAIDPQHVDGQRKKKPCNIWERPKFHGVSHAPDTVEDSGPLDGGSTQTFYPRTNKVEFVSQIANHQWRAELLRHLRDSDPDYTPRREAQRQREDARALLQESLERRRDTPSELPTERSPFNAEGSDPHARYDVGNGRRNIVRIYNWLAENAGDPALENFLPLLRSHCLPRLLAANAIPEHLLNERSDVTAWDLRIEDSRLYTHKVIRFNYTTYDMRRNQDSVNPRTHPDVMVWAPDESSDHPYAYARVLSIFHLTVSCLARPRTSTIPGTAASQVLRVSSSMDVLWVRWFKVDSELQSGFTTRRLPRLQFVPHNDASTEPFGFLDPATVVRASYLIPAFHFGKTERLLGESRLARCDSDNLDYAYYYACMFVDRDMYMRYLGGGVGHREQFVTIAQSRQHALREGPLVTPESYPSPPDAGGHTPERGIEEPSSSHPPGDEDNDAEDAQEEAAEFAHELEALEELDERQDEENEGDDLVERPAYEIIDDPDYYEDDEYEAEGYARP